MKKKLFILLLSMFSVTSFNQSIAQDAFMGEVKLFAGNFAPRGWMICDGKLLSISSHTALYSLIGNFYGGDGRTTFALPDLRGRTPIGVGKGPGLAHSMLGEVKGSETTTLTNENLPNHNHLVKTETTEPVEMPIAGQEHGEHHEGEMVTVDHPVGVAATPTTMTGLGDPVNIMQPSLGMNYIICVAGIFPSRGE